MAKMVWKLARWLLAFGLLLIGAKNVPEPSSTLEQRWRDMIPWSWLEANWIALACFVLAAVLFLYQPLKWWVDRQNARDARQKIRTNLTVGSFPETDAYEVLRYLLTESVWGWKQYARLNFWQMVDGLHLREFERAGLAGDIVATGFGPNGTAVIGRRFWNGVSIDPATISTPHGVVARTTRPDAFFSRIEFSELAVASADIALVWPRASLSRRLWSLFWVRLKKRFWYGSPLSNRLDKRRRRLKEAERRD